MSTALVERADAALPDVQRTVDSINHIREFVGKSMTPNLDFGAIPGTDQKKKNLLLPGAQKACMYFNVRPRFIINTTDIGNGHCEHSIKTELVHRTSGEVVGEGLGSCCTMESKYRFRNSSRKCPKCGAESIIKGKVEYGAGWLCWGKKGGCNGKFRDGDPAIESQVVGKIENDSIWDSRNTVLKIAKKRSLVDAALTLSCLSEFFTQDLETNENGYGEEPQRHEEPPHHDEPPTTISKEQGATLKATFANRGVTGNGPEAKNFMHHFGISKLGELRADQFDEAVAWIASLPKKEANGTASTLISAEQAAVIGKLLYSTGITTQDFLAACEVDKIANLPAADVDKAMAWIEANKRQVEWGEGENCSDPMDARNSSPARSAAASATSTKSAAGAAPAAATTELTIDYQTISTDQADELLKACVAGNVNAQVILDEFRVPALKVLPATHMSSAVALIAKHAKKKAKK